MEHKKDHLEPQKSHTETRKVTTTRKKTLRRSTIPLARLYNNLDGFKANTENLVEYKTTYGEVLPESIPILFEVFQKHAPLTKITMAHKNFYDLGCGIGKIVIGFSYLNPYLKSTGVEIVPERIQMANDALSRIRESSIKSRIEFYCISIMDDSINYSNACWIWISNLVFTPEMNAKLFEKLAKEVKKGCLIVCSQSTNNTAFSHINEYTLPMSWSQISKVHVYIKN